MLYKALEEVEEEMLDMVVPHLEATVVPVLFSLHILHKYSKNIKWLFVRSIIQ
jgi:hypothetical protein